MTETTEAKKQRSDAGKRRALTNLQRFQVMEALKANGSTDGKWFKFAEGWSDERIARQVDCAEHQVASIRRDCFGDIKAVNRDGHSPIAVLFAELKTLRDRVAALEAAAKRPANEDHTRLTLTGDNVTRQVVGFSVAKPNGA
jgi:hypothetical protein